MDTDSVDHRLVFYKATFDLEQQLIQLLILCFGPEDTPENPTYEYIANLLGNIHGESLPPPVRRRPRVPESAVGGLKNKTAR